MTYQQIRELYIKNGYPFETKPYFANMYGRRNADLKTVNQFNDIRGVAFTDEFCNEHNIEFKATTKPGLTSLTGEPMNKNGTFILMPGFYKDCWILGTHGAGGNFPHRALIQRPHKVFKGWRDNNRDGKFDFTGPIYDDVTGLNDHTTRPHEITNVGAFSYACIVTKDDKEHLIKVAIAERHAELYGNLFSFALFQD